MPQPSLQRHVPGQRCTRKPVQISKSCSRTPHENGDTGMTGEGKPEFNLGIPPDQAETIQR
jgi:hypothetical protein